MFGLASPRRRNSSPSSRVIPRLEPLEGRDCPSYLTLNLSPGTLKTVTLSGDLTGAPNVAYQVIDLDGQVPATQVQTDANGHYCVTLQATGLGYITAADDDGSSNTAMVNLNSPPPMVRNLQVRENNGMFTFTGQVIAPPPTGVTLALDDGASLQSAPVTLRPDGTFSYSVQLNVSWDAGRMVTATATDCWGQTGDQEAMIPD